MQEDIESICKSKAKEFIDLTTLEYVASELQAIVNEASQANQKIRTSYHTKSKLPSVSALTSLATSHDKKTQKLISSSEFQEEFTDILQIVPDTKPIIVKKCLDLFKGDKRKVLEAIFDDKIPAAALDHSSTPSVSGKESTDLATAAAFGMIHLDSDKIWQGKKSIFQKKQELFGDKKLKSQVKKAVAEQNKEYSEFLASGGDPDVAVPHGLSVEDLCFRISSRPEESNYDDEVDDSYEVPVGNVDKSENDVDSKSVNKVGDQTEDKEFTPKQHFYNKQRPKSNVEKHGSGYHKNFHKPAAQPPIEKAYRIGNVDKTSSSQLNPASSNGNVNFQGFNKNNESNKGNSDFSQKFNKNKSSSKLFEVNANAAKPKKEEWKRGKINKKNVAEDSKQNEKVEDEQQEPLSERRSHFLKDRNKARVANHNRRFLADKKRGNV